MRVCFTSRRIRHRRPRTMKGTGRTKAAVPKRAYLSSEQRAAIETDALQLQHTLPNPSLQLSVRPSTIPMAGQGLFVAENSVPVEKGVYLGVYLGAIHSPLDPIQGAYNYHVEDPQSTSHTSNYIVRASPQDHRSMVHFANHFTDPAQLNAYFELYTESAYPHCVLRAAEDIAPGTEIITSYGSKHFDTDYSAQERQALADLAFEPSRKRTRL